MQLRKFAHKVNATKEIFMTFPRLYYELSMTKSDWSIMAQQLWQNVNSLNLSIYSSFMTLWLLSFLQNVMTQRPEEWNTLSWVFCELSRPQETESRCFISKTTEDNFVHCEYMWLRHDLFRKTTDSKTAVFNTTLQNKTRFHTNNVDNCALMQNHGCVLSG